jgi:arabinofuranosyltransferase
MSLPHRAGWLLLAAASLGLIALGWREMSFLCDDAFIAFRYARNVLQGWGPTWNPPPFAPVEGYTSALWVGLLSVAWAAGTPPPVAAEALSLLAGLGTGGLALVWLRRIELREPDGRLLLAATAMLGIGTNRTLLTWTSSGLETSLFNLLIVAWLYLATDRRLRGPALALVAALLTLTRPDGLLYSAATVAILASRLPIRRALAGASPLLIVGAHLVWRRATYGLWLPNTYFAKVSEPWPEAGLRYLGAFLLEHGLWLAVPILLGGAALAMRAPGRRDSALRVGLPAVALLAHVAYYTLRVGGDHFEYRVLSHLVVPIFVALAWASDRLIGRRAPALVLLIVGASWPLAWTHHALGRHLDTRAETEALFLPVAPYLPPPLSSLAALHDENQRWLIERYIARRHREHVVFRAHLERTLAQPAELSRLDWETQRPIASARSVGVVGWRFHQAAILDELGLNDRTIARGPLRHADGSTRRMAHDRQPPPGYLACFRQNLTKDAEGLRTDPAIAPMTDAEIEDCDTRFLAE